MAKLTDEERAQLNKISEKYEKELKQKRYEVMNEKQQQKTIKKIEQEFEKNPDVDSVETILDKYQVFENKIILPQHKEAVIYALKHCDRWVRNAFDWNHRSFHTKNRRELRGTIERILRVFCSGEKMDAGIVDIFLGNISEEQYAYANTGGNHIGNYGEEMEIACAIDSGNQEFISMIKDIINGVSDIALEYYIVRGVMMAGNQELHDLIGNLLLAAKLEEGLRQAVCENADRGTVQGFLTIVKVIYENNLIRFSSVKRALGTWTGLVLDTYASGAAVLERVSDKTIALVYECLTDEKKREEYLLSEDCFKIHTALWAYGVYELDDMLDKIRTIGRQGTYHQILTAGYAMTNTGIDVDIRVAVQLIKEHLTERDIVAVYLHIIMDKFKDEIRETLHAYSKENKWELGKRVNCSLKESFLSESEAEELYEVLKELYQSIKGKQEVFSPCIFPWYQAALSKNDVVICMAYLASALKSNDKIDAVAAHLADVSVADSYFREDILKLLLYYPETERQRELLIQSLGDKESYTRGAASMMAEHIELNEKEYKKLEELLKYKNAEIRGYVLELIVKQPDDALYACAERLLQDKKEEKRTAGLDILLQLKNDEKRQQLFEKCVPLALVTDKTTSKEEILIKEIQNCNVKEESFYDTNATYEPVMDEAYMEKAKEVFERYFPKQEETGGEYESVKIIHKLDQLIKAHRDDEVLDYDGETKTLEHCYGTIFTRGNGREKAQPLRDMWTEFYEKEIGSPQKAYRAYLTVISEGDYDKFAEISNQFICSLIGEAYTHDVLCSFWSRIETLLYEFVRIYMPEEDREYIASYVSMKLTEWDGTFEYKDRIIFDYYQIACLLFNDSEKQFYERPLYDKRRHLECTFPIQYRLLMKLRDSIDFNAYRPTYSRKFYTSMSSFEPISVKMYLYAAYKGIISSDFLYKLIFAEDEELKKISGITLGKAINQISSIASMYREINAPVNVRGHFYRRYYTLREYFGVNDMNDLTDEDIRFVKYIEEIYEYVIRQILSVELKRGDTVTKYSKAIRDIERIYGVENYVAILAALGSDTLDRSTWYYGEPSKKNTLSHLLSVCVPNPEDNAEKLRELVSKTDIKEQRLIEAAMFSAEWLDMTEEYLGWEGLKSACYYFIAHMNESFSAQKKAMIAKYTPLSEEELTVGAFDIDWFKNSYETLGEKRFTMVYKAAKYISDGTKHTRARKYADAVTGKLDMADTMEKIRDKRNKDLLMALALIPLKDDKDLLDRYLFIQEFVKGSKQFGAQRQASERQTADMAKRNLATNAGIEDVLRLNLRMESKLMEANKGLRNDYVIDEITVKLEIDENGKTGISCVKNGKKLKAVPAKYKKNEYIVELNATKKKFNEQNSRTRKMLEESMEDMTEFTVEEIGTLLENPVTKPVVKNLVFCGLCESDKPAGEKRATEENILWVCNYDKMGFISKAADEYFMTNAKGEQISLNAKERVVIVHPFYLYKSGVWRDFQKYLFDHELVQPFKQVFRELYVKTEEEMQMKHSLRYAGNQIQPKKTAAVLRSRRWVADIEDGLQKVYYKENIIARIYAIADWFSPSDIEAPTLEWVEFSDRNTGRDIEIEKIPDIIFSEVMRDVDLAVSVAHSGEVDPETSHSTIEMRIALLEFALPLFKVSNVEINGTHAHITGERADYTVHLGSGVVHQKGGTMINILAVRSSHKGRLFLPFADEDPKTAEIITKILYLADDKNIKDPSVLSQIQ